MAKELLIPLTHLDEDWADRFKKQELSGELKLMLALIEDAIHTAENLNSRACLECREWIEVEGDEYVFSFESACEALGLSASYLRRGILMRPAYCEAPRVTQTEAQQRPGRPREAA